MSTIYFNLKPTMLDPEGARLIGAALAAKAAELGADTVGGLEMGAVPLVSVDGRDERGRGQAGPRDLRPQGGEGSRHAKPDRGPCRGREPGGQSSRRRRGRHHDRRLGFEGGRGLREAGATVTDVVTVLDREEGADEAFAAAGITLHALFRKSEFARGAGLTAAWLLTRQEKPQR